ncbi:MAG: helix-turn-helix domain-containing protein [Spirochaetes bacterium]|nr:helix-turn-helix domain-containing protein [Spirochaetota bacterium]
MRSTRGISAKAALPESLLDTGAWVKVVYHRQRGDEIPHTHAFHELVLVRSGRAFHVTEDGRFPIGPGDCFLVKPGLVHTYEAGAPLEIVNLLFDPARLALPIHDLGDLPGYRAFFETGPRLRGNFRGENGLRLRGAEQARAESRLDSMRRAQEKREPGWRHAMACEFMALIGLLARASSRRGRSDPVERLEGALRCLESLYPEPVRQEQIAARLGVSVSTLARLFRQTMGKGPMEALQEIRLEAAARLLENTGESVSAIAENVGFVDGNYFSKVFRGAFGVSPRDFRRGKRVVGRVTRP